MRLTEARQGVRMLKFMDGFGCWDAATLNRLEVAELLAWANGRSAVGAGARKKWARPRPERGPRIGEQMANMPLP